MKGINLVVASVLSLVLVGCGGGGGSSSDPVVSPPVSPPVVVDPPAPPAVVLTDFEQGIFSDQNNYAGMCTFPRSGSNPITGDLWADQLGTVEDENYFLRSWSNDFYLWYSEITDQDPASFSNPLIYFDTLKTNALTPTGTPKDQFHFFQTTDDFLLESQAGVSLGFGMNLNFQSLDFPPQIFVNYVEPGSPADNAGIKRGWKLIQVFEQNIDNTDNTDFDSNDITISDILNILFPEEVNDQFPEESVTSLSWIDPVSDDQDLIITIMSPEVINNSSVLLTDVISTNTGDVGYMVFNSHNAIAESELAEAVLDFKEANISDLILDMRYNGGGYLAIASQLAFMIAGTSATEGKAFETLAFNDKHTVIDPISLEPLAPTPFYNETLGFVLTPGIPLPELDLRRVYVLTSSGTCSASESIINGLNGIAVEVILIGDTTCGKPYGFYPQDNCGITYFSIQFQGKNALGFGDYTDGFAPQNKTGSAGLRLPGCEVADDLNHPLGDVDEGLLNAALAYRDGGACPAVPAASSQSSFSVQDSGLIALGSEPLGLQRRSMKGAGSFVSTNKLLGLPR